MTLQGGIFPSCAQKILSQYWRSTNFYFVLCNGVWNPATATITEVIASEVDSNFGYLRQLLSFSNGTFAGNVYQEGQVTVSITANGGSITFNCYAIIESGSPRSNLPVTVAGNTFTTATPHLLIQDEAIVFSGDTLPTGIAAQTLYYATNISGNSFQVAASPGGSAIALSSAGFNVRLRYAKGSLAGFLMDTGGTQVTIPAGATRSFPINLSVDFPFELI